MIHEKALLRTRGTFKKTFLHIESFWHLGCKLNSYKSIPDMVLGSRVMSSTRKDHSHSGEKRSADSSHSVEKTNRGKEKVGCSRGGEAGSIAETEGGTEAAATE